MTQRLKVEIMRTPEAENLPMPAYQTADSAGFDLMAALPNTSITIQPGCYHLVPTGLIMEIPRGYEGQVRPRSGFALKHGVTVLNSPGTIDSDYRGEVGVILINHGKDVFHVTHGMRIAQMIIAPIEQTSLIEVETVTDTVRGTGGYGSTGK